MRKKLLLYISILLIIISIPNSIFASPVTDTYSFDIYASSDVIVRITAPNGSVKTYQGKDDVAITHTFTATISDCGLYRYKVEEIPTGDPFIESDISVYYFNIYSEYDINDNLIITTFISKENENDKPVAVEFEEIYKSNVIWIDGVDENIIYKSDNSNPIFYLKNGTMPIYPPDPTKEGYIFDHWEIEVLEYHKDGTPKITVIRAFWRTSVKPVVPNTSAR